MRLPRHFVPRNDILIGLPRFARNDRYVRLLRFARNDIQKVLPNYRASATGYFFLKKLPVLFFYMNNSEKKLIQKFKLWRFR